MSVADSLTLKKATQALDKVKGEFEIVNGRLDIITQDRYDEAFDIIANHFIPDAPLCQRFGVTWHKDFEKVLLEHLKANVSICMITKDTNEIMGVRISGVMKKTNPPPQDFSDVEDEPSRSCLTILAHKDKEVNFFERYEVDEAIHFTNLGVKKNYRRMGIGGRLVAASVEMCRELGFKAIKVEATSNFSQRVFEKQGFDMLITLPYDSYFYNGRPLIDGTGEHTMTKIYGVKL